MTSHKAERRFGARTSRAYPAVLMTKRRRILGRGRTANISQRGVYLIADCVDGLPESGELLLELRLPDFTKPSSKTRRTRTVQYTCRVVRSEPVGQLRGLAVQFIEKRS